MNQITVCNVKGIICSEHATVKYHLATIFLSIVVSLSSLFGITECKFWFVHTTLVIFIYAR